MKIERHPNGTYLLTVSNGEDEIFYRTLRYNLPVGEKLSYCGRHGLHYDPDFYIIFEVHNQHLILREDNSDHRELRDIRSAIFSGDAPTLAEIGDLNGIYYICLGVTTCRYCGKWMHGCARMCDACMAARDHKYE